MKKLLKQLLSLTIITVSLSANIAWADFNDVSSSHPNFEAINALQDLGIINGYSDGSFKPDQSVNRAEFLKIILDGSEITLDETDVSPFTDVNHDDWYGPYIKKAYAEGWLVGYQDGTARPAQTINKVEALKILGEVQKWQLKTVSQKPYDDVPKGEWFTPYVTYAKDQGFLQESGKLFMPAELMSRADISETIFRTISSDDQTSDDQTTTKAPETTISASFFDNIKLDENFPESFFPGEIYVFEGSVTSGGSDSMSILLENGEQEIFQSEVDNDRFSVAVHFNKPGDYLLGIFPGSSGSSKGKEIKVIDAAPTLEGSSAVELKDIFFKDNETKVQFSTDTENFKKFSFIQGSKTVSYYNRQNISEMPIFYKDFEDFSEGNVELEVSSGGGSDSTTFRAVTHEFSKLVDGNIDVDLPETISSSSNISFSGITKTQTNLPAFVINPDGFVETVDLATSAATTTYYSNEIIPSGKDFSFNYDVNGDGTYIVEINQKDNTAVVNHPVYVGDIVPLLPDFFDLNKRSSFSGTVDLSSMRNEMLAKINASRIAHGLSAVTLSDELNELSQGHSDDMKANNYFGHINLQGESPEDRRINAGITTPVGENLASDVSLDFAHEGLMRSAGHRENILDSSWDRVGIGIANDNGYLIITEEFSINPVTAGELTGFKSELIDTINQLREDANVASLAYNDDLENVGEYINNQVIDEGQTLSQSLFSQAIEQFNISGSSQGLSRISSIWNKILESIVESDAALLQQSNWERLGVDLQLDDLGNINTIILINN